MARTINVDSILFIENNDEKLEIKEFPIKFQHSLLSQLEFYTYEDGITPDKLYKKYKQLFPRLWSKGYCIGKEYDELSDSIIKKPIYPHFHYSKYLQEYSREYTFLYDAKCISFEEYERKKKECKKKAMSDSMSHFLKTVETALPAINYECALIELSNTTNAVMYSTDYCGWKKENFYKVSENIDVILKTNFCYGSSSYFIVSIRYKGIDILPYSFLTKYRYARRVDLIRGTRSYLCKKTSWNPALEFVVKCANEAKDDPEGFIRDNIESEIQSMITGLRSLIKEPHVAVANMLDFARNSVDDSLTYNSIEPDSFKKCLIYPSEAEFALIADKVTGALEFLENLKALNVMMGNLQTYIDEIIEVNKSFLPRIKNALKDIEDDIEELSEVVKNDENEIKSYKELHIKGMADSEKEELRNLDRTCSDDRDNLDKRMNFRALLEKYCNRINEFTSVKQIA